jgi:hypothetical protein
MATINLGSIKFNWRGAYNAGTAYAIDDVVSYNGSSYIAKTATTGNLPTVTANWDIMSSAGTNGTDLTTTLTTQGDILYRDGSGLARLGYGTTGKVLTTKGSGQNPTWETPSGGIIQYKNALMTSSVTINYSDGRYRITALDVTLDTAPTTGNSLLILGNIAYGKNNGDPGCAMRWEYSTDNSSWSSRDRYDFFTGGAHAGTDANGNWTHSGSYMSDWQSGADTAHASLNTIVTAANIGNARYFRVTARQTDNSNHELCFGKGHGLNASDSYAASSTGNLTIIELGA